MNHKLQDESATLQQEYLAFISYRHSDNTEEDQQWATWLHNQLEVYDVPDDLIGTTNLRGEIIPAQIYPVFLDEVSLPAEADLSSAITQALDRSRFLIVLCSPGAVQSRYVNEEILHFKRTGKAGRIMAALIEGEPNASIDDAKIEDPDHRETLECFPSALQYALTIDNQLDIDNPCEPIAANFRLPDGSKGMTNPNVYKKLLLKQGRNKTDAERLAQLYEEQINNARLKIIAGILGVPLEQLTQRDKIYQLHKAQQATQRFRKIALSMGVLALAALIAGGIAIAQWRIAKTQQERAEKLLGEIQSNLKFMNFDLRVVLDKYVPQHERLKIIQKIDNVVNDLQKNGNSVSADTKYQIAIALMQKADLVLKNDKLNPTEALSLYQQGLDEIIKLSQQDSSNALFQSNLSISYSKIGALQLRLGNTNAAFKAYQDGFLIAQALSKLDPLNTNILDMLLGSVDNIGDVQLRLGNTEAALNNYQEGLGIAQTLRNLDPNNTEFQRGLSSSYLAIGDIQLRLSNIDAAFNAYKDGLTIVQNLIKLDPRNTEFQHDLYVVQNRIGDIQLRLSNIDAALNAYKDGLTIVQNLIELDPSNVYFQRDLSAFHDRVGNLQLRLGNIDSALKSYQDSLSIRAILSRLDLNNTESQRNLSVSHEKIGDLQLRLGNTDAAFKAYKESMAIRQMLINLDHDNTQFQNDMSRIYYNIGNLQLRLGMADEALKSFQDGLAIRQALVKLDPKDTEFQSDLSTFHQTIGNVQLRLGNVNAALNSYQESLEIIQVLVKANPKNNEFQRNFLKSLNKLGDLQLHLNNFNSAIKAYQDGLEIVKNLIIDNPDNTDVQRGLWFSYSKLFEAYKAKKDSTAAKMNLEKALQLINVMKKNGTLAKDDEQTIKTMEADLLNLAKKIKH